MPHRHADTIADDLEQRIVTGQYADGERLDEMRLCAHYGVSRTPVREALLRLSTVGLVQMVTHRGTFVRQPGPVEVLEMFEVMAELEAFCARLAAARISQEGLDELNAINAQCRSALGQGPDAYFAANERFHRCIRANAGNTFLEGEVHRLHHRLRVYRRVQLRLRGRPEQSMAEHEAVLDAIARGDADGAASALRAHVGVQGEKFRHLMRHVEETARQASAAD